MSRRGGCPTFSPLRKWPSRREHHVSNGGLELGSRYWVSLLYVRNRGTGSTWRMLHFLPSGFQCYLHHNGNLGGVHTRVRKHHIYDQSKPPPTLLEYVGGTHFTTNARLRNNVRLSLNSSNLVAEQHVSLSMGSCSRLGGGIVKYLKEREQSARDWCLSPGYRSAACCTGQRGD